jgi:hypothetical protein
MSDASFKKLKRTDQKLFGPKKMMMCGFSKEAQMKFQIILDACGLSDIPKVWLNKEHAKNLLSELVELPDETGADKNSTLPRAVIVSGIAQKELHALMTICRKTGMKQSLWAALTPVSETWELERLLGELQKERDFFKR